MDKNKTDVVTDMDTTVIEVMEMHTELQAVTVATEANDGFLRFLKSAEINSVKVEVLGMGQTWEGGDIAHYAGGGHKVNLLKDAMKKWKDSQDVIIMFVDSYDLIMTGGAEAILKAFLKFDAKIVFSAEGFCWPDEGLRDKYPPVKSNEKRFLNSGGFMGYAPEIYKLVTHMDIANDGDDQLYYTNIFLNPDLRGELSMKLDVQSEIFQNLNGALDEVKVKFKGRSSYLYNMKTGSLPFIIHGNGPIKPQLNSLTNYLGDMWTPISGCVRCKEDAYDLTQVQEEDYPVVLIAIHVDLPVPFLEDLFNGVAALSYPTKKIHLFIHYNTPYHDKHVKKFVAEEGDKYLSKQIIGPTENIDIWQGKNDGINSCLEKKCQYYLVLDGEVQIEKPDMLEKLIERNRTSVTPLLIRPGKMWSTFWGALNAEGYYKRSDDYADIVQLKKIGLWNVPYVSGIMLIKGDKLPMLRGAYSHDELDPDMAICKHMREKNLFLFVDNQEYYGHLVNADNFEPAHFHDDMYEVMENQYTWEKKYIHSEYKKHAALEYKNLEPCTDVFWLPFASPRWCSDLIEEVEKYGKWSGGKNKDDRLAGGYENVPTVDIHTNQIGWEQHWLYILRTYIAPLANKIFTGYYSEGRAIMNFVVRYKPGEQDRLRPHHDSSTYTINMALNRVNQDYQGGGVRFTRYNCSITDLRQGWLLLHPGRLTHQHEGLRTTNGTRYIMVSFIDP